MTVEADKVGFLLQNPIMREFLDQLIAGGNTNADQARCFLSFRRDLL